jgi:hypothetical protein
VGEGDALGSIAVAVGVSVSVAVADGVWVSSGVQVGVSVGVSVIGGVNSWLETVAPPSARIDVRSKNAAIRADRSIP